MKHFELGHVYDVTEYVKKNEPVLAGYTKYYVTADVWDFHVYRILEGFNSEYEKEPGTKLIEQGDISKQDVISAMEEELGMIIPTVDERNFPSRVFANEPTDDWVKVVLQEVIALDDGENEDVKEFRYDTPMNTLISVIDGGYGITILDAELNLKMTKGI